MKHQTRQKTKINGMAISISNNSTMVSSWDNLQTTTATTTLTLCSGTLHFSAFDVYEIEEMNPTILSCPALLLSDTTFRGKPTTKANDYESDHTTTHACLALSSCVVSRSLPISQPGVGGPLRHRIRASTFHHLLGSGAPPIPD